ncbi:MAG: hypothetical protein L0191_10525 [Acidobacteria bacterium]|nr:hypothetical protein [Acidobacteriota bacterium]
MSSKRTKTGVARVSDADILSHAELEAGKGGDAPAPAPKVHTFTEDAFRLVVKENYLGCKSRFNQDSWRARVEFLRKEKNDPNYGLTVEDIKELIFTEELSGDEVDDKDRQPLVAGTDNVVALIVIPLEKDGKPNDNGGDLLRHQDGTPKERGLSITVRKEGDGPQPLEVISFRESNRRIAEEVARRRKQKLTSRRQATARAAVINGNESDTNDYLSRRGGNVRRERDERGGNSPFPRTPRGQARVPRG